MVEDCVKFRVDPHVASLNIKHKCSEAFERSKELIQYALQALQSRLLSLELGYDDEAAESLIATILVKLVADS